MNHWHKIPDQLQLVLLASRSANELDFADVVVVPCGHFRDSRTRRQYGWLQDDLQIVLRHFDLGDAGSDEALHQNARFATLVERPDASLPRLVQFEQPEFDLFKRLR
jgi:hypothetical protein